MWLSEISIKRPVLATVMSLMLVLFGVVGWMNLSVREYPDIDPPVVSVNTIYLGANAEVIESTVTEGLEDELIGIEGIKSMTSTSRDELSNIVIEFNLSKNVDIAAQDVRDRVSRARGRLPDDIEEPIIAKQDADAQAIMWLSLSGKDFSPLQITDYADRYIVDQLQVVPGVGRVIIGGARVYSMRIWLDPIKMANRQVTVLDVESALRAENVELPSGRIEGINREFTVRTLGELNTPDEFNRLIIKRVGGLPIYLNDIGYTEIGPENYRSLIRFNGKPAVGLGIVKQSKANTLEVAKGVKKKIEEIRGRLPKGLDIKAAFDSSVFIEKSVHEVEESLYLAFGLVVLVIYIFLRNGRAMLIPTVSIPISIIATFAVMYFLGYTINIITLLGLTLTIGLVVDDSIVVLENIYRRIELGESPMEASFKGIQEIAFAVVATTVVLVSVFLPIVFADGLTGRLLREFAVVVACSVLISMFVSLTLTPMLCSRWLKKESYQPSLIQKRQNGWQSNPAIQMFQRFIGWFGGFFDALGERYETSLGWALDHKKPVLIGISLFIVLAAVLFVVLPKEFIPIDDQSTVFTVVRAPEGASLSYTDRAVQRAEEIYKNTPEVVSYFSAVALSQEGPGKVNSGLMFVRLKDPGKRDLKQQEVVSGLFPKMSGIPEAMVFPINLQSGPAGNFGQPVQMVIQGDNINELATTAERIKNRGEQEIFGFIQADVDLKLNKPQLSIEVDREKASTLGVSVRDVARTLQIMLAGLDLSTFKFKNKRYNVMVQSLEETRQTPDDLSNIFVKARAPEGSDPDMGFANLVPMTNIIKYTEGVVPPELGHYNRLRSATISGGLIPIVTLGEVMEKLEKIAREEMSADMSLAWKGQSKEFKESGQTIYLAFALALIVVFLTLAAQFESYRDPFIVMLTVPLAIGGAILTLFLLKFIPMLLNMIPVINLIPALRQMMFVSYNINIYSQIGMIMLIGLVTKNGILIVEFANQIREKNPAWTAKEAVFESAKIRFRPILMTSLAMIMGSLPIAIGLGAGIDSRKPLGAVLVGGLALSTLLTLYVIPIAYDLIQRKKAEKPKELQPH